MRSRTQAAAQVPGGIGRGAGRKRIKWKKVWAAVKLSAATAVAAFFAVLFLTPIVLTITNSFM